MIIFELLLGMMTTMIVYAAYILVISFTLWMSVDAAKQDRYWWVVLIIGVPIIGSAVYFFTEKKHLYAEAPSHHIHTSETEKEHETSPKKAHKKHEQKEEKQDEVKPEEKKEEVAETLVSEPEKKEEQ